MKFPVLEYLRRQISGAASPEDETYMRYPTAISRTLDMRVVDAERGGAAVEIDADPARHGNQQGTVHGGLICELADAAIGTAHSTLMAEGESFATLELKINFFRPVWKTTLRATAKPMQSGGTITHYRCDIVREDGKTAAVATSTVMTLRGEKARGR
ncbi:MAG: PaaI family thioesterase [Gammaproteobacteria bacterium]